MGLKKLFKNSAYLFSFSLSYLKNVTSEFLSVFWKEISVTITYLVFLILYLNIDISPLLHLCGFLVFIALFFKDLKTNIHAFYLPTKTKINRSLEVANKLRTGYFDFLKDNPVDTKDTQLWFLEQEKQKQSRTLALKTDAFKTNTSAKDPYALRFLPVIVLLLCLFIFPIATMNDIAKNFFPHTAPPIHVEKPSFTYSAWITPPSYTGLKPDYINDTTTPPLSIAQGSKLNIALQNIKKRAYHVHINDTISKMGIDGDETILSADFDITADTTRIALRGRYNNYFDLPIFIEQDNAPEISFVADPKTTNNYALEIDYRTIDDYGPKNISLSVERIESTADEPMPKPLNFDLSLGFIDTSEAEINEENKIWQGQYYLDLSGHPWAGAPVKLTLSVTDHSDQKNDSAPIFATIPVRVFENKIAKKINDERMKLLADYKNNRTSAMAVLEEIIIRPAHYYNDPIIFLSLKSAMNRLFLDRYNQERLSVTNLLWDVALFIEEGLMFEALQDIKEIQQALEKALQDPNSPPEQIEELMQQYQAALENAVRAAMTDIMRQLQNGAKVQDFQNPFQTSEQSSLEDYLQKMQDLAASGNREEAMKMLQDLQKMMEQTSTKPQQLSEEQKQGIETLQDLQEIIEAQQELTNDSKKARALDDKNTEDIRKRQTEIQSKTQAIKEKLVGLMPETDTKNLDDAMTEMQNAIDALSQTDTEATITDTTITAQEKAEEHLQKSGEDAMQAMQSAMNMQFSQGNSLIPQMGQNGQGQNGKGNRRLPRQSHSENGETDPLGREPGNAKEFNGDLDSLSQAPQEKSRDVINELRKRSGERSRPQFELDYINRLLERF